MAKKETGIIIDSSKLDNALEHLDDLAKMMDDRIKSGDWVTWERITFKKYGEITVDFAEMETC